MPIAIQPKASVAKNPRTLQPYVATSFTVDVLISGGAVQRVFPRFLGTDGKALPHGAIAPVVPGGSTPAKAYEVESAALVDAVRSTPGQAGESMEAHAERAATATLVKSRALSLK